MKELSVDFKDEMIALFGADEANNLFAAIDGEQVESVRFNSDKPPVTNKDYKCVPWCGEGRYLPERLTYTFDPLLHAGAYYVQEASSMFLAYVLRQYVDNKPVTMLDLCAAPGGKSTLARSVLPDGSLLVTNEIMRNRAQVLAENITKWGNDDVVVTSNKPSDFVALGGFFDVLLTDVPCSGEGMFRKDDRAISEWSLENVENCCKRQREILHDIWPSLKEGGLLIYSTCTFNTKEDEENVRWIIDELGAESLEVNIDKEWHITGNLAGTAEHVYRFIPGRTKGEGFFMSALRKTSKAEPPYISSKINKKAKNITVVPKEIKGWIDNSDDYLFDNDGISIVAVRKIFGDEIATMRKVLNVMQYGVRLANVKGREPVPAHALAMCTHRKEGVFPEAELSYDSAIAYLRTESVTLPDDVSHGFVIVTYKGFPLGFVKNVGRRANNFYPQEWRIRSGYKPDEIKCL